jgi:outer membrane protein TolC
MNTRPCTFGSSDLDAAISEAVARNQTLAAAKASVAEARELVKARPAASTPR